MTSMEGSRIYSLESMARNFSFLSGAANDDAFLGEGIEVEGVEGLAEFHEDVVGDVDDVVDGAQADGFDALDEPVRGGCDFDVADDTGGVIGAAGRIGEGDGGFRRGADGGFGEGDGGGGEVGGGEGGEFSGESEVGEAVGAIGGDFDVEDVGVVEGGDGVRQESAGVHEEIGGAIRGGDGGEIFGDPVEGYFH